MANNIQTIALRDICLEVKTGLSSYYLKKKEESGIEMPVINIKDVREGYIDVNSIELVEVHVTDAVEKAKICHKDVIISTKGSNFRAAVADTNIERFVFSANLTALTISEATEPEIVAAYLNCSHGQQELNKRAGGSSIRTINTQNLLDVPIPIPSTETRKELSRLIRNTQEYTIALSKEADIWAKITEKAVIKSLGV